MSFADAKEGATSNARSNETFFKYFQHEVTALQDQITRLEDHGTSGGERADAVEHCLAGISRLSNEVKDASSSIPAYDQRTYSEAIKALTSKLQDVRTKVQPKPKFSFKSSAFTARKNASAISLNDAAELANQKRRQIPGYVSGASDGESSFATTPVVPASPAPETVEEGNEQAEAVAEGRMRMPPVSQAASVSINNHEHQHIILPPSAGHAASSGTISNLRSCVIDLSSPVPDGSPFASITLKNIKNSLVICGQVDGPMHLTKITNTVVVVACRQFRMHESHDCDVYLHASSRPIIEDCTGIRFAPLPESFGRNSASENQWQAVDDFKWLKAERSPNWSVLPESQRIADRVWTGIVRGGPGIGTAEILQAVQPKP